jgi:hypothetical protein
MVPSPLMGEEYELGCLPPRLYSPPPGGRIQTVTLLPPHILPKQQNTIAVLELAIQTVADAQDGAIDHDLDMLP